MFVEGVVRENFIPNATIDTWETQADGNGQYDNQLRDKICFCDYFPN